VAEPRRGTVLLDLALVEKALSTVVARAAPGGAVGVFFIEIKDGKLRLVGQGWEELVPLRSWAPDQVYGAYFTPQRMHLHSKREGQFLALKQLGDSTLIFGHWQCRPTSNGAFWHTTGLLQEVP